MFRNCTSVETMLLPPNLATIGSYLFGTEATSAKGSVSYIYGMTSLKQIVIPATVSTIGDYAFNGCTALENVVFETGSRLISLGANIFADTPALKEVVLPGNLRSVGRSCFENSGVQIIDLPTTVTIIGDYAFLDCNALTTANFPNCESIGIDAFYNCDALTTADFPNCTSIGIDAFWNSGLTTLILRSPTMCDVHITACMGTPIITVEGMPTGEGFIYVPTALYESYVADLAVKALAIAQSAGTPMDEATATYMATVLLRKLEDYTVDGTITGELDESKV
jgi:hypothetical protein